jgi:hypothetical protein
MTCAVRRDLHYTPTQKGRVEEDRRDMLSGVWGRRLSALAGRVVKVWDC